MLTIRAPPPLYIYILILHRVDLKLRAQIGLTCSHQRQISELGFSGDTSSLTESIINNIIIRSLGGQHIITIRPPLNVQMHILMICLEMIYQLVKKKSTYFSN